MLVLLYSTDMLLKSSVSTVAAAVKGVSTLVRLRSSSRVPFINHSTLVIVPDVDKQLNIESSPLIFICSSSSSGSPGEDSITINHEIKQHHYT